MKRKWMAPALIALISTVGVLPLAQGQDAQALYLRSMAASCTACHGTDGNVAAGSPLPALAGMPRDYVSAQLKAFKAGTRTATVMHQIAKGYTDAQIDQIAGYFASVKK